MPRGKPKSKPDVPAPTYGDGRRLEEHDALASQAAAAPTPQAPPAAAPQQAAPPAAAPQGPTLQDLARSGPTPGAPLGRPSERPGEPVTSGVPIGRGPNSLAPMQRSAADFYEQLAAASGDPYYMHLANLARRRG